MFNHSSIRAAWCICHGRLEGLIRIATWLWALSAVKQGDFVTERLWNLRGAVHCPELMGLRTLTSALPPSPLIPVMGPRCRLSVTGARVPTTVRKPISPLSPLSVVCRQPQAVCSTPMDCGFHGWRCSDRCQRWCRRECRQQTAQKCRLVWMELRFPWRFTRPSRISLHDVPIGRYRIKTAKVSWLGEYELSNQSRPGPDAVQVRACFSGPVGVGDLLKLVPVLTVTLLFNSILECTFRVVINWGGSMSGTMAAQQPPVGSWRSVWGQHRRPTWVDRRWGKGRSFAVVNRWGTRSEAEPC